MNNVAPITIGMPVYNGGSDLRRVLDSLLAQSFTDFMLLISDNASTDNTADICQEYARADSRIRYVRQTHNIGAEANFRYVFLAAQSKYFMWAAADDTRSSKFIELNYFFLERNPDYLGSTCPVHFRGRKHDEIAMGDAPLDDDDPYERIVLFFRAWHANGRFYSLFRRDAVASWAHLDGGFLGSDWTLVTHLASKGKLNRVDRGWVELGLGGVSNTTNIFARYRRGSIDWVWPFHRLTRDTWQLMSGARLTQRALVTIGLARLNLQAFVMQLRMIVQKRKVPM
ncbi:MAG: glycosyltransferase family 2 protein [Thiobacillus sp.]